MTEDRAVHVEWVEDEHHAVLVTHFDFDGLDSLEDRARELLSQGQPVAPLLEEAALSIIERGPARLINRLLTRVYRVAGGEVAARIIQLILDAPSPRFRAAAIAHEIGATLLGGESIPQTAAKFGKSKQALTQEMERVRAALGFELPRVNRRPDESRARMRLANFRHKS